MSDKAWVVFREYQSDTPDILAVFSTEAEAEAYAEEQRKDEHEEGENVYGYEPGEDEREETRDEADWSVTIGVAEAPFYTPT